MSFLIYFLLPLKFPICFDEFLQKVLLHKPLFPHMPEPNKKFVFHLLFLQFLAFILVLSLLVTLFSHVVTKAIAVGFDAATVDLAAPLVAINFYYLPIIFVVTFMAALLQYKHHFATTAFSTALLNLALIAALLISKDLEKYTITYYLSYGVLAGGFLQLFVHILALRKKTY